MLKHRLNKNFIVLIISSLMMVILGCQPVSPPKIAFLDLRLINIYNVPMETAGQSLYGRDIEYTALGTGENVTFIIASIHGNEIAGSAIAWKMIDHLQKNPELLEGRTVVILPIANPDGTILKQRYNANQVDLNRNFSAANRVDSKINGPYALSEPESQIIYDLIEKYSPDKILSFHESLNCLDYDGPGEGIANAMGQHCNLPVKKLGSRPGSLGAYAGETLEIPIITVELTDADLNANRGTLWEKYGKATLAGISYLQP